MFVNKIETWLAAVVHVCLIKHHTCLPVGVPLFVFRKCLFEEFRFRSNRSNFFVRIQLISPNLKLGELLFQIVFKLKNIDNDHLQIPRVFRSETKIFPRA